MVVIYVYIAQALLVASDPDPYQLNGQLRMGEGGLRT